MDYFQNCTHDLKVDDDVLPTAGFLLGSLVLHSLQLPPPILVDRKGSRLKRSPLPNAPSPPTVCCFVARSVAQHIAAVHGVRPVILLPVVSAHCILLFARCESGDFRDNRRSLGMLSYYPRRYCVPALSLLAHSQIAAEHPFDS